MGRKFGFSWSWKRASGLSAFKGRIATYRNSNDPLWPPAEIGRMMGGCMVLILAAACLLVSFLVGVHVLAAWIR